MLPCWEGQAQPKPSHRLQTWLLSALPQEKVGTAGIIKGILRTGRLPGQCGQQQALRPENIKHCAHSDPVLPKPLAAMR